MIYGILLVVLFLISLRWVYKPIRYTAARYVRLYANWISPDNF